MWAKTRCCFLIFWCRRICYIIANLAYLSLKVCTCMTQQWLCHGWLAVAKVSCFPCNRNRSVVLTLPLLLLSAQTYLLSFCLLDLFSCTKCFIFFPYFKNDDISTKLFAKEKESSTNLPVYMQPIYKNSLPLSCVLPLSWKVWHCCVCTYPETCWYPRLWQCRHVSPSDQRCGPFFSVFVSTPALKTTG